MNKIRRFLGAALITVLLPCVFTVFFNGSDLGNASESPESGDKIQFRLGEALWDMTEEEYLLGALAAAMPMDREPEALKAMAVILRTNLRRLQQQSDVILLDEDGYTAEPERIKAWGMDAYLQYQRLGKQAIEETAGLVLKKEGQLIDAAFHGISAGKTRTGAYPYLRSVDSAWDLEAEQYLTVYRFSKEELETLFASVTAEDWKRISFQEEENTSYIRAVALGDTFLDGEEFRNTLSLCSSAYFGSWEDGSLQIVCKGQGHGFGFSCYGACRQAEEGKDFQELLTYYYGNITIENE